MHPRVTALEPQGTGLLGEARHVHGALRRGNRRLHVPTPGVLALKGDGGSSSAALKKFHVVVIGHLQLALLSEVCLASFSHSIDPHIWR